jgi:hypothetical protein
VFYPRGEFLGRNIQYSCYRHQNRNENTRAGTVAKKQLTGAAASVGDHAVASGNIHVVYLRGSPFGRSALGLY